MLPCRVFEYADVLEKHHAWTMEEGTARPHVAYRCCHSCDSSCCQHNSTQNIATAACAMQQLIH